jgi:hypothetical protein
MVAPGTFLTLLSEDILYTFCSLGRLMFGAESVALRGSVDSSLKYPET